MKKIATLFKRDLATGLVMDEATEGCQWVLAGEGTATRKFDGTCCMVRGGNFYRRAEVKPGKKEPAGFELSEADPNTGKSFGWVLVGDDPSEKWHREAWVAITANGNIPADWTYELIGPKVQGNPEHIAGHILVPHGSHFWTKEDEPGRTFAELKAFFERNDFEGIVWWRDPKDPNCDKVKLKGKDFGVKRPTAKT
jgi:hypothetical protein